MPLHKKIPSVSYLDHIHDKISSKSPTNHFDNLHSTSLASTNVSIHESSFLILRSGRCSSTTFCFSAPNSLASAVARDMLEMSFRELLRFTSTYSILSVSSARGSEGSTLSFFSHLNMESLGKKIGVGMCGLRNGPLRWGRLTKSIELKVREEADGFAESF